MRRISFYAILVTLAASFGSNLSAEDPVDNGQPNLPAQSPGTIFWDALRSGGEGPPMVVIPAGRFRMGCLSNDHDCFDNEKPVRNVRIAKPFAVSAHEVTFEDFDRFTGPNRVDDEGWGRGSRPVINVSAVDALGYAVWLSEQTGAKYRLLSEAEWEYAARAGTTTNYNWGDQIGTNRANCDSDACADQWEHTAPVGSFAPNAFGLYDMHGNVWEWAMDCWHDSYQDAPKDGSAWMQGSCSRRIVRGGSWSGIAKALRSSDRVGLGGGQGDKRVGFRVARALSEN